MSNEAKKLFATLTRAQQEVWGISVKAGFKPVVIPDAKIKDRKVLRKLVCKKCGRNAIVFKNDNTVFAVCSNKHAVRLES
jgi:hypothetical protein